MKAAGFKNWHAYNLHSFRIGGATALLASNCSIEQIKAMGRWSSDVAEVYARPTRRQLEELSIALDTADTTPFEDADDEYFDRAAGVCEDDTDALADVMAEEADAEDE